MKTFHVSLTTMAYMRATVEVKAKNAKEAEKKALKSPGDIDWKYDGLCEGEGQGPEVKSVSE